MVETKEQTYIQEIIDLFYYHVVSGSDQLKKDPFLKVIQRAPADDRQALDAFVDGLLGIGQNHDACEIVAQALCDRLNEYKKSSLMVPRMISALVEADLRFSTEITPHFAAVCFRNTRLQQAVLDILVRLLVEKETADAPMFDYVMGSLSGLDLDDEQRKGVFISLAKNLKGSVGRLRLSRSSLLPENNTTLIELLQICDRDCAGVVIQGLAESDMELLEALIGSIADISPQPSALEVLGRVYLSVQNNALGEQVRARVRAFVVKLIETMRDTKPFYGLEPSLDRLAGIYLGLGLAGPISDKLSVIAVNCMVDILDSPGLSEKDFPELSQVVINVLSKLADNHQALHLFSKRIGSITGHLYTALKSEERQEQARVAFKVLEHIVNSQSRIGKPLPAIKEIVSQYRKLTSSGPSSAL